MAEQTGQEKTHKATPKKRRKAREEGQVPKSKDLNSVVILGAALGIFMLAGGWWMEAWVGTVHRGLDLPSMLRPGEGWEGLFGFWTVSFLRLLAPFLLVFPLMSLAVNISQVGLELSPKVLVPKITRLSPSSGLKRIFSLSGLVELVKSIGKVLIIGWIAYGTLRPEVKNLPLIANLPLGGALSYSVSIAFRLVMKVWIALVLLAVLDLLYQRWNYERELKMTKQEFKEEMKETEGDPHVRARIRSVQMNLARKRMMQEVPNADVVITNPDHVAVALRYDRARDMAPVVVAKGAGHLCARIKEIARRHAVPVVERPPLARFLYRHVDLGGEIPVEVYRVVAEILSYVYQVQRGTLNGAVDG